MTSGDGPSAPAPDPGLARERTDLAWNRSGLAVLVALAILLRRLWPLEGYKSVLALSLMAFGAITWVIGLRMARRSGDGQGGYEGFGVRSGRMLTVGTVALAVAGFILGLVTPA